MTAYTEWAHVRSTTVAGLAAGEFEDDRGTINDGPALAISTDVVIAIEANGHHKPRPLGGELPHPRP